MEGQTPKFEPSAWFANEKHEHNRAKTKVFILNHVAALPKIVCHLKDKKIEWSKKTKSPLLAGLEPAT